MATPRARGRRRGRRGGSTRGCSEWADPISCSCCSRRSRRRACPAGRDPTRTKKTTSTSSSRACPNTRERCFSRSPRRRLEALLLLRNLCFHDEAKAHVAANPRALDAPPRRGRDGRGRARRRRRRAPRPRAQRVNAAAALLRAGRRPARIRRAAGRAYRAATAHAEDASAGAGARTEAAAHASKCLAALAAVLGVAKGGDPVVGSGEGASPDSTLLDIDDEGLDRIAEECSDGLAVGPKWVY